ncbi:GNAT family N-acetyltransferase [Streptomyces sp. MST-110588]|uniref:GNAT family N-acetyltransferase n=1 Tax=Streptomyces sp. MST-110588 TaxID=2833628 RepID=UPI001F5DFF2B|nr:GNAT family N-acetyltransferase [Streptomyces sp. MST-110588]UNO39269.1 GNAT family N-acetyltransferase [Streptomyces sp. MST-110588]
MVERLRIRNMTQDDIDAVADIRVRGWQAAYVGLVPQAYLDGMSAAEEAAHRRAFFAAPPPGVVALVAERDGELVGFAGFGPVHTSDEDTSGPPASAEEPYEGGSSEGELYTLYLLPECIGTGVGRALLDACLEGAARNGFRTLRLWVLKGNAHARRFYEKAGFRADGAEQTFEVAGVVVPEVRYRRPLPTTGNSTDGPDDPDDADGLNAP